MHNKRLLILGSLGVPAESGSFEMLAAELAPHLVQKGWAVTVYCREPWNRTVPYETMWGRVRRVHIPVKQKGFWGDLMYALKSALHARNQPALALTLGNSFALFSLFQRLRGKANFFYMGPISYQGEHIGGLRKLWGIANERLAGWLGQGFIVDNPAIQSYLGPRIDADRTALIPNGALLNKDASQAPLKQYELEPQKYSLVVAKATPDYALLELVTAYSQIERGQPLVVVADMDTGDDYAQQVIAAASDEVVFIEPIYEQSVIRALYYHAYMYIHVYKNGGTGFALVDALAAGNAVLAYDTASTRWVTGSDAAVFFTTVEQCSLHISELLSQPEQVAPMKKAARLRHAEAFTLEAMFKEYESFLDV